jgi:hypothetical protein
VISETLPSPSVRQNSPVPEQIGVRAIGETTRNDHRPIAVPVRVADADLRDVAMATGSPEVSRARARIIKQGIGVRAIGEVARNDDGPVLASIRVASDQTEASVGSLELAGAARAFIEEQVGVRIVGECPGMIMSQSVRQPSIPAINCIVPS